MPAPERRSLSSGEWISIAIAAILVGAIAFVWYRRSHEPVASAPPAPAAAQAPAAEGPAPTASDERVRSLLAPVSSNPLFRRSLSEGDLVRRWTVIVDNLAEGVSPRKQLLFLAPTQPFSAAREGRRHVISPQSYARFDAFADAVASVDAKAFASACRELHAVLEGAYRALGYPGASFDAVVARALHRIEAAPVKDGPVAVESQAGVWIYADPKLEALGPVEKQLLRMGPRNEKLVQAKAREIREALGLPSAEVAGQRR